jgi:hypothetical protein
MEEKEVPDPPEDLNKLPLNPSKRIKKRADKQPFTIKNLYLLCSL